MPHYRLLRTKTKQRIFKKFKKRVGEYTAGKISRDKLEQSLQSYLGTLSHADAYRLSEDLKNQIWFVGRLFIFLIRSSRYVIIKEWKRKT